MNYAEKELSEAMAYLEVARAERATLQTMIRALELGLPVEITFRTAGAVTAPALCPSGGSATKLLTKLEQKAFERVSNLENQEVHWCQEVAFMAQHERINLALRANPTRTFTEVRDAEDARPYTVPNEPTPPAE